MFIWLIWKLFDFSSDGDFLQKKNIQGWVWMAIFLGWGLMSCFFLKVWPTTFPAFLGGQKPSLQLTAPTVKIEGWKPIVSF